MADLVWSLGQLSYTVLTQILLLVHWTSSFISKDIWVVRSDFFSVSLCRLTVFNASSAVSDHLLFNCYGILMRMDITLTNLNSGIHIFLSYFWKWLCDPRSQPFLDLEGVIHLEILTSIKQLSVFRLHNSLLGRGTRASNGPQWPETHRRFETPHAAWQEHHRGLVGQR